MKTIKQAFVPQLTTIKKSGVSPSNGDFLSGTTRDAMKSQLVTQGLPTDKVDAYIDGKIQEHRDHSGSYHVHFVNRGTIVDGEMKMEVLKCWSDAFSQMESEWEWRGQYAGDNQYLPILVRKT